MAASPECLIGIDVAKATLDVHVRPAGQALIVPNAERDIAALAAAGLPVASHACGIGARNV